LINLKIFYDNIVFFIKITKNEKIKIPINIRVAQTYFEVECLAPPTINEMKTTDKTFADFIKVYKGYET
jgi:hypothetical protein